MASKKQVATSPEVNRLKAKYDSEIVDKMMKKFNYSSKMEVPKLEKIVLNMRLGDVKDNSKSLQSAVQELEQIAGQKAVICYAKKSVANFKLREGQPVGAKITLRGSKMWEFFDKLISIALPRVRDFRGVSDKSFDGRGNYALGIKEQLIFPEIAYDKVEKVRGFDITIVTSAKTDEESKELLSSLGMPFVRR
ncbi:MAG TPA: 50S ribosomal protein L5 [Clostridiales bacterium]|nr:50S ribosomal protein L5 [Clostridiales bacterium]